jgi:hypothetical protein
VMEVAMLPALNPNFTTYRLEMDIQRPASRPAYAKAA